jgi:hypothetical protein
VLTDSLKHVVFKPAGREVRDGFSSQLFPGFGNVLILSIRLPIGLSFFGNEHLVEDRICAVVVLKPAQCCPLPAALIAGRSLRTSINSWHQMLVSDVPQSFSGWVAIITFFAIVR